MASRTQPRRAARRADENAPTATTTRSRSGVPGVPAVAGKTALTARAPAVAPLKRGNSALGPSSNATYSKNTATGALPPRRAALGPAGDKDKAAPTKGGKEGKDVASRRPLASTSTAQAAAPTDAPVARKSRAVVVPAKENTERAARPVTKRKTTASSVVGGNAVATSSKIPAARSRSGTASTSTTATTSADATRLRERKMNVGPSRGASVTTATTAAEDEAEAEAEAEPARKKRKTSSPAFALDDLVDDAVYDKDGEEVVLSSGGRGTHLRSPKQPRPKDFGWTDLDAEDEGDPTMVAEYVVDAFNYMVSIEPNTMPDAEYMTRQSELDWSMRKLLMEWLIEVHTKFRLLPETLLIAVNLIDRFLSRRVVSMLKLQLVGLTALFIAAKYEEVICPSIQHFAHMTDDSFGQEEILRAERYMLSSLGFDLSYPNPLHFLRRVSKADAYDVQSRTVAKFLIDMLCVERRLLDVRPSKLAAAAMWLARLCLQRGEWTPNLVHYSGFAEEELLGPAQIMLDYVLAPDFDTSSVFYKKYAAKKHMKASVYVRAWACARWPKSALGESAVQGRELEMMILADDAGGSDE